MKPLYLLAASLAFPAAIATAQTTDTPTNANGQIPYIPLIGHTAGQGSSAANSAWYIDTARNLVVLCTQVGGGAAGGTLSINCTAQATPTSASSGASAGGDTGSGSAGNGASGGDTAGNGNANSGASANPFGG